MSIATNRRAVAVLTALGALLLAAFAAAPQAEASTIYACVKKKSGTARFVTKKTKCKKGETKVSWNTEGLAGKNGANGTNGATGKEGTAGKEGSPGKNGLNGTAVAYAEVNSTGTLGGNSKGVTKMTPGPSPVEGVYCLEIPGTLHVGVGGLSFGGGTVPGFVAVDMAPLFEVLFEDCAVGTTVAVHTYNAKGEIKAEGFFAIFD
jgi:hypothetical protein